MTMFKTMLLSSAVAFAAPSETGTISAQSDRTHAQRLANQAGKPLSDLLTSLILKGEEVAAGPVTTLAVMRKQHGDDALTTDFPRLGSGGEDDKEDRTNQYTEFYKADELVNGETKTRDANFFTDYYLQQEVGKHQTYQLEQIKYAQSKGERDKAEEAYRQLDVTQLANLKKRLTNAKSKGRGYVRKAVGCWHVLSDLAEAVATVETGLVGVGEPLVSLTFADQATENSMPFDLVDNTRKHFYRPMSVSDVLKLDVNAALKEPGNLYDALDRQLSRDTKNKAGGAFPAIDKATMWLDAAFRVYTFIDYETDAGEANGKAIREMMARKKGGDHAVLMVGKLRSELNQMWTPEMQVKYDRLINEELVAPKDTPAQAPARQIAAA